MSKRYSIYQILLTVAGEYVVDGEYSHVRFLDAVDGSAVVSAGAKLTVKADRDSEGAPFRLGQGFLARDTRRWVIAWDAQPGITATLGFAVNPNEIDWDADPATQLLSGSFSLSGHPTITSTADKSLPATATTEIIAANTARRLLRITNLDATAILRIGDSGAAATEGEELPPGETMPLPTTAAVFAHNPTGGAVTVSILEFTA